MFSRAKWLVIGLMLALIASCGKADERLDMSQYVMIYPGSPVFELPGERGELKVKVRNVAPVRLTELRLEVKSDAVQAEVQPAAIGELTPGQRGEFSVVLTRRRQGDQLRYPLALTLRATGLPSPAGLDLLVDLGPRAEEGWINVGEITLIHQEHQRTVYYLLAGAPLVILLGWLLWRWSRPRPRPGAGAGSAKTP